MVTLRKHVTKYKNMRKYLVEFLRKSWSRGDKIVPVNSIRITKSINLILYGVEVRCDRGRFSVRSPLILWRSLWVVISKKI